MRKLLPVAVALGTLVFAAYALAAVTNVYNLSSTVNPAKAGTKKKPQPIGLTFAFTVKEASGQRPSVIHTFKIGLGGIHSNGALFKKCTADQINAPGPGPKNKVCSPKAVVATGSIDNSAGATSNPADKSQQCHLTLTLYNAGQNQAALYVYGNPQQAQPCPLPLDQAIPATFVPGPDGGTALEFSVPQGLEHPIPGLDNAIVKTSATIVKQTAKKGKGKKAKKHGYLDSIGGCKKGKRTINATFTTEAGQTSTTTAKVACHK